MKTLFNLNVLTITTAVFLAHNSPAQTNSWTKPTSGFWHEPFWSLGSLPDASQSHIMFTNAGWKALAINNVTARDYPASLNIPRLTVSSPTGTVNTLLLNFAGVQSPLRVAGDFDLGSNSTLLTLSSALEVGNDFLVDGAVNHGDNSAVSASYLYVGNTSPGIYNFSNGLLRAGYLTAGLGTTGSLRQLGGLLSVTNQLTLGQGNRRTFAEGSGHFELTAGTLTAPTIQIGEQNSRLGPPGADGTFVQSGGSNIAGRLLLGWPDSDASSGENFTYILNAGLLMTSNTFVYGGNGNFTQAGGLHRVDGPLAVAGFYGRSFTPFLAQYTLNGGVVTARSLNIDLGSMSQSAGTNQILGSLLIGRKEAFNQSSFYNLSGGILGTSNTIILNSEYGSFSQSGGAHTVGNLEVAGSSRSSQPGYTLSAGELIAKDIRVSTNGGFSQSGGSAAARDITVANGEYTLLGGDVTVSNMLLGYGALGSFEQSGGRLSVANGLNLGDMAFPTFARGTGQFTFSGGTLSSPVIRIGYANPSTTSDGAFIQSGGSNFVDHLEVGPGGARSSGDFTYNLNNGLLNSTSTVVNGYAEFLQAGGVHSVNGPLLVRGYEDRTMPIFSTYILNNGIIRSRALTVGRSATFSQSGGTNLVEGGFVIGEDSYVGTSDYSLSGGVVISSNTTVLGSYRGRITHDGGGVHTVAGILDLQRPITYFPGNPTTAVRYALNAGQLIVRDIRLSTNAVFQHTGGTLSHSGTLTLEGGTWQSAPGDQQLNLLDLEASVTNSSLILADAATGLRFANSSGVPWHSAAALVIHNWRGSTNGGGAHRIVFGTDQSGLTSQQLAQLRFRDPAGLAPGDYSATILNTGEIIPLAPTGRGPAISYQRSPGQLRMEWPEGYTLQTATNILGPFEDVEASSPHTVNTTADPQRFFRFRQ